MDLENEAIRNGRMEADVANKEEGEEENSVGDKIYSDDENFPLLEMTWNIFNQAQEHPLKD
ncbi:hypothetical protein DAPPUDRAFT_324981 [Daphnia pulex]|uniref:Uncharacterized protein n=1 Tax=Daphnia pulex TaxID=6669 RepID=E9H3C4_DAPPU|nr:hypothetical protein DAPPUDRAFT_324981 [Daphnia pulex]|eukprot:EFX73800.1 hypothetical protein DAPPUDRAFT_324981 [Daphnia pulex]